MNFQNPEPPFMVPPPQLQDLPVGSWGISYDISTPRTQLDLPHGWNAYRSETYRELKRLLEGFGFVRHQYSDYRADNVTPIHVWTSMWSLRLIRPPMKLQTTILGLKMHHYSDLDLLDITEDVQLGGEGAPQLLGPIPALLLPDPPIAVAGMHHPHPGPPIPGDFDRPTFTRPSANADNPMNWMV
ncbi:hypothetical protein F5887DRAFT_1002918 [Amanita rubescens]|nr:hypothetical protein F5887DRAFT_1002918 [Amanita rubescens]